MWKIFLVCLYLINAVVGTESFDNFSNSFEDFKNIAVRELTPAEHAEEMRGSNWAKDMAEYSGVDVASPDSAGFTFAASGLVIAGYLTAIAHPVGDIITHCRSRSGVANSTAPCVTACLTFAGASTAAVVVGSSILYRGVALVQDLYEILNIYKVDNETKEVDTSKDIDSIEGRSQPCPNNNQYGKNFGAAHCHFPNSHAGFKYSCKRGCANTPLGGGTPIKQLLHAAANKMLNQRALNMEQTLYIQGSKHVLFRCSVQLETVSTNTCVVPITGNTCHF